MLKMSYSDHFLSVFCLTIHLSIHLSIQHFQMKTPPKPLKQFFPN